MDIVNTYLELGSYRGAADLCGVDHKTVKRVVQRSQAKTVAAPRVTPRRGHNTDCATDLIWKKVKSTRGRITAKRLLPQARTAGYEGSARNFRRAVALIKAQWARSEHRRRPWVPNPGEHLVIDWGEEGPLKIFCAVLAWSRYRFVRFSSDMKRATTLGLVAECIEEIGAVPHVVLSDRMGCLRAQTVANVVVPHPDYVRFATHFSFRPDFCEAADPESKGVVEALVGYAKSDLVIPSEGWDDVDHANLDAKAWCHEVNARVHSEICAIPAERLTEERRVMRALPSLRPPLRRGETRKVDRMSTVRFGSARYSVPSKLIGQRVEVVAGAREVVILSRRHRRRPASPGRSGRGVDLRRSLRQAGGEAAPGDQTEKQRRACVHIARKHRRRLPSGGGRGRDAAARDRARRDRLAASFLGTSSLDRGAGASHDVPALQGARRSFDPCGRDDAHRGAAGHRARPRCACGRDPLPGCLRAGVVVVSAPAKALAPDLTDALKRLKLRAFRQLAPEVLQTAKTQRWAPEEVLRTLIEAEIAARDESNLRNRLRAAGFPVVKGIDDFKVAQSSVPQQTFDYISSLEWVAAKENLCLIGPAGTGKSHLLVAAGHAAVESGLRVRYLSAADLIESLYRGLADNSVGKIIDSLLRFDLVIVDELGFAPLDDHGTQLLFRFVAAAYERRSLGIASHWPFEQWGRFLPEHTTAASMLDRLLHHAVVVVTEGESFRMKEARSRGGGRRKSATKS